MKKAKKELTKNDSTNAKIIWGLILLPPLGIYLALKHKPHILKKVGYIVIIAIYTLFWFGLISAMFSSPYDWSSEDKATKDKYQSTCEQRSNELASDTEEYAVCKRVGYPVHEVVTEKEKVPFTEERVDDPSLAKGEEKVEREGVDGEKTIFYTVKYEKNEEISKDRTGDKITKEPISKLIKVGTYVAPVTPVTPVTPAPSQTQSPSSTNNTSPDSGVTDTVSGYCNDGTYVTGNPSARGRANACYGHGGWRDY